MKFLIVGLGSMGKRRVRNLRALGRTEIAGFDQRADRRNEVIAKYGIPVYDSFEEAVAGHKPDALIISTGPKHHMDYAWDACDRGLPCFIEASVVEADRILGLHNRIQNTGIIMAPSCTMRYSDGPRHIKKLIAAGVIGRPLNLNYLTGQYLPDWHPWENIGDFYVSDRETGGCREIVPFELTWINDVFGDPEPLACVKSKLTDMNADIDDVYHCLLRYPGGLLANLTVEVISRPKATRELRVLGSMGELVFSADENCVRYIRVGDDQWTRFDLSGGTVETGYINPEEPYIAEMADFVSALEKRDPSIFPNTLKDDWRVLQNLYRLEQLSEHIA
ncbi:3-chlorobenzoate-3,4-dioxygenase dehydrogenase [Sulfuricaulis limicola]|uniref:3-chlorobenzoate-3,4-dioxygenase dehydrogenase n=1 Tax=Sulfuricaulis limicola TaxID=1620215 RepID=A0A1B4XFF0_9GAMM|nr:Gfo/Idh/MocA family oxidoreductase [Sulfuricaulis limicola]BAV33522.1 3-chlorobenzoate-3,4-dioxygenase dehydrogenase [Sulfuricaulis limicola]